MKKILVVSDSHRMDFGIKKVVNEHGPFDRMIHLGDSEVPESVLYDIVKCPMDIVAGNNDMGYFYPNEKIITIAGKKILLTHGHMKGVNYGMDRLTYYGMEKEADIVMFGHTHRPYISETPQITLINPGSITLPRQSSRKCSWVLMTVDEYGIIRFEFKYL